MASVLRNAQQTNIPTSIALDYRVDDESLCSVAAEVPKWFSHLGSNSRKFWKLCAHYLLKHPSFAFEDLASDSGIDVDSLKAMHRNSYRAIKQEGSPNPLWSAWDHGSQRNIYRMDPVVRDEMLCLTINDE